MIRIDEGLIYEDLSPVRLSQEQKGKEKVDQVQNKWPELSHNNEKICPTMKNIVKIIYLSNEASIIIIIVIIFIISSLLYLHFIKNCRISYRGKLFN